MYAFISNHFSTILMIMLCAGSIVLSGLNYVFNKKVKPKTTPAKGDALSGASEVLVKVYKMLPSLITFSETMNSNKSGALKKDFVLSYIKNMYGSLGVEIGDDLLAMVSSAIDDIVTVTKQMHIGEDME